jgi:hypothetical protein
MDKASSGDQTGPLMVSWPVRPAKMVRVLFLIALGLLAASLTGQAIRFATGDGHLWGFTPKFNLDAEMNVPTWFASFLFLLAALLLVRVGATEAKRGRGGARRRWHSLALVFLLCSIDEVAAIHEMLVDPVRKAFHAGGLLYFSWVIPGIALVAFLAVVYGPLFLRLPADLRWNFIAAAVVFLAGTLGMEMLGGAYVQRHGPDHFAYALLANTEEFLELLGQILFIKALLALLEARGAVEHIAASGRKEGD